MATSMFMCTRRLENESQKATSTLLARQKRGHILQQYPTPCQLGNDLTTGYYNRNLSQAQAGERVDHRF